MDTLKSMDKVRFGRALGYGARHAAKTLAQAVEAASAPSASGGSKQAAGPRIAEAARAAGQMHAQTQQTVRQARTVATQVAKTSGKGFFSSLTRLSGVLWLEVTGTFFAFIALFLGNGAWKHRAAVALAPSTHDAQKLYLYTGFFALFAYFAVSSFVRARRRERR